MTTYEELKARREREKKLFEVPHEVLSMSSDGDRKKRYSVVGGSKKRQYSPSKEAQSGFKLNDASGKASHQLFSLVILFVLMQMKAKVPWPFVLARGLRLPVSGLSLDMTRCAARRW